MVLRHLLPVAGLALLATGCASGQWSTRALAPTDAGSSSLQAYTALAIHTTMRHGLTRPAESDRARIVALVIEKVKQKAPGRFTAFNPPSSGPGVPGVLHATIAFQEYDAGHAVVRYMRAGIGQMHVAADVVLEDRARPAQIGIYQVKKTFAWREAYDAMTKLSDIEIEAGLADAVAAVLLGEAPEPVTPGR